MIPTCTSRKQKCPPHPHTPSQIKHILPRCSWPVQATHTKRRYAHHHHQARYDPSSSSAHNSQAGVAQGVQAFTPDLDPTIQSLPFFPPSYPKKGPTSAVSQSIDVRDVLSDTLLIADCLQKRLDRLNSTSLRNSMKRDSFGITVAEFHDQDPERRCRGCQGIRVR